MKVQTKITLLLALVVVTFLGGVLAFRTFDRIKFKRIAEQRFSERTRSFDDFLRRNGEPLQTLAADYTCLDQMVDAIATGDLAWFAENVNAPELSAYRANVVWIYRPDGTLVYQVNNLGNSEPLSLPIGPDNLEAIFDGAPLRHFCVKLPQGLLEVRAGTVHPSKDFRRQTEPRGYFFAGRLWNQPAIDEMAAFTGNKLDIVPVDDRSIKIRNDDRNGSIAFDRLLPGWDGKPVARLVVRSESPVVQELNRESTTIFVALIFFALLLLLFISSSLMRWVRKPLRTIMESLTRNDPKPIEAMCSSDNSEFGELARTVRTFFQQRDNLIREMEERRVTEEALRKSEDELRHAQKLEAVGRLAGGVAHDFNNLLTAIVGYAELLASRHDDPVVREHAAMISRAGEQAATLTRQLLAFSRKQLLVPRVIDLNRLVVDMEQLLQRVIGERFNLKTIPSAPDGRVKADPNQLEQVILNLGVNARDAMPNGGTLVIRTGNTHIDGVAPPNLSNPLPSGDYVVLAVTDNGAGMDDKTKARIFEPFFTTKGPGKGTGLGLATVYGIVRQSGGGISVESEPGRGSTFRIYLPHEDAPVEHYKQAPRPIERAAESETVLVAEDEEIVRELVCDVLEHQGYHVLCAADGREALELAKTFDGEIDLLITDVVMPQMSGQELAETLSFFRPEMKVLFVTGYSDHDFGGSGTLNPQSELLQKPFTPHELVTKIREIMGQTSDAERAVLQMQLSI